MSVAFDWQHKSKFYFKITTFGLVLLMSFNSQDKNCDSFGPKENAINLHQRHQDSESTMAQFSRSHVNDKYKNAQKIIEGD